MIFRKEGFGFVQQPPQLCLIRSGLSSLFMSSDRAYLAQYMRGLEDL